MLDKFSPPPTDNACCKIAIACVLRMTVGAVDCPWVGAPELLAFRAVRTIGLTETNPINNEMRIYFFMNVMPRAFNELRCGIHVLEQVWNPELSWYLQRDTAIFCSTFEP